VQRARLSHALGVYLTKYETKELYVVEIRIAAKPSAAAHRRPGVDSEHLYSSSGEPHLLHPKSGATTEWRKNNRTNGLAFDAQGRLFSCCSGGRSIALRPRRQERGDC
jgi:hypothetical protein